MTEEEFLSIRIRGNDAVRPGDDVVLRAGGGEPEALVASAIENAPAYEPLVATGRIRSAFTISVHIPRAGLADRDEILRSPLYVRYKPYLSASARSLLDLGFVDIVPTTWEVAGETASPVDRCHFDVVIEASGERELRDRVEMIRALFVKFPNPFRAGTVSGEGGGDA